MFGARLNKLGAALKSRPPQAAFNFALSGQAFDERITYTGASARMYFDSTGTLRYAPMNLIRNSTMQGAVAGSPGTRPTNWNASYNTTSFGIAASIEAVGTEAGIAYIDVRYQGTATVTGTILVGYFDAPTVIVAAQGQTWTGSFFLSLVDGDLNGATLTNRVAEFTAAGASISGALTDGPTLAPTGASLPSQRSVLTRTLTAATCERVLHGLRMLVTDTVTYDFTLRIGLPQLELGAFATSPILTTGAAATRLADVASITGTNFSSFWNQAEGTIVLGAVKQNVVNDGAFPRIAQANDGTASNVIGIYSGSNASPNTARAEVVTGGVSQANLTSVGTFSSGVAFKQSLAYKVNDVASSFGGGAVSTDTSATLPSVTRFLIGSNGVGISGFWNGHIQSLTYYAKRLPNNVLQSLTV